MEIKADMKYIIYTIIAMDENLSELKGKFIHATESLIVRGEDNYRMVHKDDTNRLNHRYFLLDKIGGDNIGRTTWGQTKKKTRFAIIR